MERCIDIDVETTRCVRTGIVTLKFHSECKVKNWSRGVILAVYRRKKIVEKHIS